VHVWLDESDPQAGLNRVVEAAASADLDVAGIRLIAPSLEDVFIARLAQAEHAAVARQTS
jgi:hypothetical protein